MAKQEGSRFTSLRGYARERKVTLATVQKWRDRGHLAYDDRGRVDVVESNKRLDARPPIYRGGEIGGSQKKVGGKSRPRNRTAEHIERKEAALATLRQIEVDEKLCRVVKIDDASRLLVQALTLIRTRVLALPTKVAPDLVGIKHPADAQRIMMAAVSETLAELTSYAGDFSEVDADPDAVEHVKGLIRAETEPKH